MLYLWIDQGCLLGSETKQSDDSLEYPGYTIADYHRFYLDAGKIVEKTAEQLEAERITKLAKEIRDTRDKKLAACDWTQLPDAMVDKAAWAVYRQSLRDISQQPGFPEIIIWPEKPV